VNLQFIILGIAQGVVLPYTHHGDAKHCKLQRETAAIRYAASISESQMLSQLQI